MEEQRKNARQQAAAPRRSPPPAKRRPRPFRRTYLMILAVLLTISAGTLLYVHRALRNYEASQPENVLADEMKKLRKLAGKEKFEEKVSLETLRSQGHSEEALRQFQKDVLDTELSFQEDHSALDATQKTFHILSNGCKVGSATLNHEGQETKLLIFQLDEWSVAHMELTGYAFHLTAPASAIIKNNGQVLTGQISGDTATYDSAGLSPLNIEVCDVLGNSVPFDQKNLPTFTDFTISIPKDYTIQGKQTVPVSAATMEAVDELKYVKEYCPDIPDSAVYRLSLLAKEPEFKILDGQGQEVDYTMEGRTVTIGSGPVGQSMSGPPEGIDPLAVAKLWSLFMTNDLTGENHGYNQLSPYLIKNSYLQGVAWKWATGVDITFTSSHTLKTPPFQVEQASNYVRYADNCFSCDIRLEKDLVLTRTGEEVKDVINSTFYFVNYDDTDNGKNDPRWVLADYHEIQEGGAL